MIKNITYKKQGDGKDSWVVKTYDESGVMIHAELVYENPHNKDVLMWKLKAVLNSMGILEQAGSALNGLTEPTKSTALLAWEYSPTVSSNSSVAKFVQNVLGLTEEEVESIFMSADSISLEQQDQGVQNRSQKASVQVPVKSEDGSVKIESQKIRIRYNWIQKLLNWLKRIFKRKK